MNQRTSWNFACAVSSPGFLSASELVLEALEKVVAQYTGVQFDSELAVRLLDFELRRGGRYAEGVVVCGFHDHGCEYLGLGVSGGSDQEYMRWARVGRLHMPVKMLHRHSRRHHAKNIRIPLIVHPSHVGEPYSAGECYKSFTRCEREFTGLSNSYTLIHRYAR